MKTITITMTDEMYERLERSCGEGQYPEPMAVALLEAGWEQEQHVFDLVQKDGPFDKSLLVAIIEACSDRMNVEYDRASRMERERWTEYVRRR